MVDASPGPRPSLFLKKKSKTLKKKKLIYTESYKAWLGEGALLSESTGHSLCQFPAWQPLPPVLELQLPHLPSPGGHHSPLLPKADGCGAHPLSPLDAHCGYCMMLKCGFEICSCPFLRAPPCLPPPQVLLVGQAGPCPAPAGMRSTDCNGLVFPPPLP